MSCLENLYWVKRRDQSFQSPSTWVHGTRTGNKATTIQRDEGERQSTGTVQNRHQTYKGHGFVLRFCFVWMCCSFCEWVCVCFSIFCLCWFCFNFSFVLRVNQSDRYILIYMIIGIVCLHICLSVCLFVWRRKYPRFELVRSWNLACSTSKWLKSTRLD